MTSTTAPPHTDSPLHRDYPSTASLARGDVLELLRGGSGGKGGDTAATHAADDAYFEAFFHALPEVRALYDEHAQLLRGNEAQAAHNVTLQPALESLRAETQSHHDAALQLERQWPAVQSAMRAAYQRTTPPALTARLTHAASRLHESSENLALCFIEDLDLPLPSEDTPPDDAHAHAHAHAQAQAQAQEAVAAAAQQGQRSHTPGDATTAFVKRYREMRAEYHLLNLLAERASQGAAGVQWE